MTDLFGHRWASAYGPEPSETWAVGLEDLSDGELRAGLAACLSWTEDWPPTLPQFRALCRPPPPPACHRIVPALPRPPADPARAARALAEIRAILGRATR